MQVVFEYEYNFFDVFELEYYSIVEQISSCTFLRELCSLFAETGVYGIEQKLE